MNQAITANTGTIDALVDKLTHATLADGVQDLLLAALEGDVALRAHLQSPDRQPRPLPNAAAKSNSAVRPNEGIPRTHHRGRVPRHRPRPLVGPATRQRAHVGGRPQRSRQVELRRRNRSPPRRQLKALGRTAPLTGRRAGNLHHPNARVSADFTVPGSRPTTLRRTWADGAEFNTHNLKCRSTGPKLTGPTQWDGTKPALAILSVHIACLWQTLRHCTNRSPQTIDDTETAWRPFRESLLGFIATYAPGMQADADANLIKKATNWFVQASYELRNERFEVIKAEVLRYWETLRRSSTAPLTHLALTGSSNSRQLMLGVKVDYAESVALSVVSQGELHALAAAFAGTRTLTQRVALARDCDDGALRRPGR